MNKDAIVDRITKICERIGTTPVTRSDLAYELKSLGVEYDSDEMSEFVWDAYKKAPKHLAQKIRTSVINNSRTLFVVEEYETQVLLKNGEYPAVIKAIETKLADSLSNIETSKSKAEMELSANSGINSSANFSTLITGAKGVVNVRNEGKKYMNHYASLVDNYHVASASIKDVITDFVDIRNEINKQYQDLAFQLIAIFGDSLKKIDPQLFNFDSVEFLDVHGMFNEAKLRYESLAEQCSVLIGDITASFHDTGKNAAQVYKFLGGGYGGMAVAGMAMLEHYMQVSEKTNRLRSDLEILKTAIHKDAKTIKGDLGRLFVVYKTINDLYIPRANAFWRYSERVFTKELLDLTSSLYSTSESKQLKEKMDTLILERQNIEHKLVDAELNKAYYQGHIEQCKQLVEFFKPQYDEAVATKPNKPSFLSSMITFGNSGKVYNRKVYEWNSVCAPVITKYTELLTDIRIDTDELTAYSKLELEANTRKREITIELQTINRKLLACVSVAPEIKLAIAGHLNNIVKLLHLAKDIVESSLDEKLMKKVSIATFSANDITLPTEVSSNINSFVKILREQSTLSSEFVSDKFDKHLGRVSEFVDKDKKIKNPEYEKRKNMVANVTLYSNRSIQTGINLFESAVELNALQKQHKIARKDYDTKLSSLLAEYKNIINGIDNRSEYLIDVLRQLNTAKNHQTLKEALMLLSEGRVKDLTDKDIDDFINGNKQIEI